MDENVAEAIKDYYILKQQYDKKFTNAKIKIRQSKKMSVKDKSIKVKQIKKTCINCGEPGETIFKTDNNTLIAMCGCKTPCKLNININRGNYINIRTSQRDVQNKILTIKQAIIRLKMDLLFNYSDESNILTKFKKQKIALSEETQKLVNYRKDYISIVENQENINIVSDAIIKMNEYTEELKVLKGNYDDKKNDAYLKEMVELYVNNIEPLTEAVRTAKYKHNLIDDNDIDNTSDLVQREYIYSDLYISSNPQNNAKIITNRK
jgi:hypothetical protein|tara:strand:- start:562 stop:1353 length:792 start_codon:yes stop_codon:yes gene_type:complete